MENGGDLSMLWCRITRMVTKVYVIRVQASLGEEVDGE